MEYIIDEDDIISLILGGSKFSFITFSNPLPIETTKNLMV